MAWYGSPEYRGAMKIRLQSSTSKLFMVEGER